MCVCQSHFPSKKRPFLRSRSPPPLRRRRRCSSSGRATDASAEGRRRRRPHQPSGLMRVRVYVEHLQQARQNYNLNQCLFVASFRCGLFSFLAVALCFAPCVRYLLLN